MIYAAPPHRHLGRVIRFRRAAIFDFTFKVIVPYIGKKTSYRFHIAGKCNEIFDSYLRMGYYSNLKCPAEVTWVPCVSGNNRF